MAATEVELPSTPFSHVGGGGGDRSSHIYDNDLTSTKSPRRTSIRSTASGNKALNLNGHSLPLVKIHIRRLARTCDVKFLERMVPSRGPKDAAGKEIELLRRILRHIEETPNLGREPKRAYLRSAGGHQQQQQDGGWYGNGNHEYDRTSTARSAASSSSLSVNSATPHADEPRTGVEQGLRAILRELKRCEASKSVSIGFMDRFKLRRGSRWQASRDFLKVVRQNIKMVENMLPEAAELNHHDLASWLNNSSDSLERDISFFLNRGSKASEIDWDMLKLQASHIMGDVKDKWELAAESRKAFESFAMICVTKYINQKKTLSEIDDMSEIGGRTSESLHPQDGTWRSFQQTRRAASRAGSTTHTAEESSQSLRSFQRDSIVGRSYSTQSEPYRSPALSRNGSRATRSSRSNMSDSLAANVARWGGDRAATTDLISRIQALSSPPPAEPLKYIREED